MNKLTFLLTFLFFLFPGCEKYDLETTDFPSVFTGEPMNIQRDLVHITGRIEELTLSSVLEHGHCWSDNNEFPDINDQKTELGTVSPLDEKEFTSEIPGLEPGKTYYFRAYIELEQGIRYGEVVVFQNSGFSISSNTVWDIEAGDNMARITTSIGNLLLDDPIAEYGHCWAPQSASELSLGNAEGFTQKGPLDQDTIFSDFLTELQINQSYQARAYVQYQGQTYYGNTVTFFTGDVWDRFTNFPATGRWQGVGFYLDGNFYAGLGEYVWLDEQLITHYRDQHDDFWRFDPETDTWTDSLEIASYPGGDRIYAVSFTAESKGYVGMGLEYRPVENDLLLHREFYSYTPASNQWNSIAAFPDNVYGTVAFSIDGNGYVGLGRDPTNLEYSQKFYRYHPTANIWIPIADFPGIGRNFATAFTINGKAYVGTGENRNPDEGDNTGYEKDFYEYDPATDTWTQVKDLEGNRRKGAVSFSIDGYGYVLGGDRLFSVSDWWRYDPANDNWSQINYDSDIAVRTFALGFATEDFGVFMMGKINHRSMGRSVWQYFPAQ